MPTPKEIKALIQKIRHKYVLTDYDLGVLATLKYFEGEPNPYDSRVE